VNASRIAVLIPAWRPDGELIALVSTLCEAGFAAIVVVDDGSGPDFRAIFEAIRRGPRVHVLRHAVNLGKGRALKTGINFVLETFSDLGGLVTADADGQHRPEDILLTVGAFQTAPDRVVLGSRRFTGHVPLRSRFGNGVTRRIFGFLTGVRLSDTQTGLRVFPASLLPQLLSLEGERYEYEMTVLAHVCRSKRPLEVPIGTVYEAGNRSSHFDPIRDSMRIYFVLLRFYFSSLVAAAIDTVIFTLAFWATGNILASMIVGRASSLVNFALNKQLVFHSRAGIAPALWKYYLLVAALGVISYACISALTIRFGWNVLAAKVLTETVLSLVSFSVQRTFVFRGAEAE
jgi:glycosyltransferase involved in cell wall biosynthesis